MNLDKRGKMLLLVLIITLALGTVLIGTIGKEDKGILAHSTTEALSEGPTDNYQLSVKVPKDLRKQMGKRQARRPRAAVNPANPLQKVDISAYVAGGGNVMFLASSRTEADWLSRHGYPTPEELKESTSETLSELKENADRGSAKYAYLYAHELIMRQMCNPEAASVESDPCASALQRAAVLGSLPAMLQYPSFYPEGALNNDGTTRVNAWAKLAYILGEPAAGYSAGIVPLNKIVSESELSEIFGQVSFVWARINNERASLGLPPLVPDPRPERVVPPGANPGDYYIYVGP